MFVDMKYSLFSQFTLDHENIIRENYHFSTVEIIMNNPRRTARSEDYCSCPCACVCMCVVRSFLPPRASRPRNIGIYIRVQRDMGKKIYNRDFR